MTQYLTVPLELKGLSAREITGHGSIFKNVDLGGDIVLPGAFKRSLAAHRKAGTMPPMFWMHQPDKVPGKWIDIHEDELGLAVHGVFAETELGEEIRTLAQIKAVRGLSMGYVPQDIDFDDDGNRLLKEVDLWEVSPVSLAMNPLAQIEFVKSRLSHDGEYVPTIREFERSLRDVGYGVRVSKMLTAKVFDDDSSGTLGSHLRDAGDVEAEAVLTALNKLTDQVYGAVLKR